MSSNAPLAPAEIGTLDPELSTPTAAGGTEPACVVYAAVLDGDALWCAVDVTGIEDATGLALRERSGAVLPLDALRVREGRQDRLEALTDLTGVGSGAEGCVLDLLVTYRNGTSVRARSGAATTLRAETLPSTDRRWRRRAYRTRTGTVAVEVRPLEVCAVLTSVSLAPGLVRIAGRLVPGGGALSGPVTGLRLRRRGDTTTVVEAAARADGDTFEAVLPVPELGAVVASDLETWDVFAVAAGTDVRVGRRLSDLGNLRQAVRYRSTARVLEDGRRLTVRPYHTNDRFLALEVRVTGRPAATVVGVQHR